jgi:hypothetical protein
MKFILDTENKEEGIVHQFFKKYLFYYYSEKLKKKTFLEYPNIFDGRRFIPDITIFNNEEKIETVIEIIDSSAPSYDKIISYINSDINVTFINIANVSFKNLNLLSSLPSISWDKGFDKGVKIGKALHLMAQNRGNYNKIYQELKVGWQKIRGYYLLVYLKEFGWKDHSSTQYSSWDKGPTKNCNSLIIKLCEDYVKNLPNQNYYSTFKNGVYRNDLYFFVNIDKTYFNYDSPYYVGKVTNCVDEENKLNQTYINKNIGFVSKPEFEKIYQGDNVIFKCNNINYGKDERNKFYIMEIVKNFIPEKRELDKLWDVGNPFKNQQFNTI